MVGDQLMIWRVPDQHQVVGVVRARIIQRILMMNLITLRHLATLNPFNLGIRKPMLPQIRLIQTLQELFPLRPVELPPQLIPYRLGLLGEDKIIHHLHACDLMDLTFENALEITTRLGHPLQIRLHKLGQGR